jgi:hypothetical protein
MPEERLEREPIGSWLTRSLVRLWIVGVLVSCAFAWTEWDSEDPVLVNLIILPLGYLLLVGFALLLLMSLSAPIYLGVVALFDNEHARLPRRAIAVVASPLVGIPWWFWAWEDRGDSPGFLLFLGAVCLAFGLTLPFRRSRQAHRRVRPAARPASS